MKYIHKVSLFLLVWLMFTALFYIILVGIGWLGTIFGLIAAIPVEAFALVAVAVGLLCGLVALTDDEGES
ncbi:hypothetical protein KC140_13980 [Listeria monocytogenes]|uniref:Uncharacterized protein n=2 Tax=Listeria monocytogenes TaxID=1639 RepID=A0A9P1UY62_LISMN|nr:hypothetical protein [Listeria monocytogenes]ASH85344.1 hypothetical protein N882_2294 [Listeria monocytogenes serotype 1/2a str. 01-1468]EAA0101413.1 hypothetical protein [Listeria monocytogenes]EAA0137919.1 hypothetical protein [Listeria monocytogenes]EAA0328896.1 hypothetical protein [Listeria monocytogenes]EAC2321208.1 hypothetical protein [Listeria monocytogenes]